MTEEKIRQFFELLNEMSYAEWRILREQAEFVARIKREEISMGMSEEGIAYFTKSTGERMRRLESIRKEGSKEAPDDLKGGFLNDGKCHGTTGMSES